MVRRGRRGSHGSLKGQRSGAAEHGLAPLDCPDMRTPSGTPSRRRFHDPAARAEELPLAAAVALSALRRRAAVGPRVRQPVLRRGGRAGVVEALPVSGMRGGPPDASAVVLARVLGVAGHHRQMPEGQGQRPAMGSVGVRSSPRLTRPGGSAQGAPAPAYPVAAACAESRIRSTPRIAVTGPAASDGSDGGPTRS